MNKTIIILVVIIFMGCTTEMEPQIHPSDWVEVNAENSHMQKIAVAGIEGCKSCHGSPVANDYFGGKSGVSCYDCHESGPSGHPVWATWMQDTTSLEFHGFVAQNTRGFDDCQQCHGNDFSGGSVGSACTLCHADINNW